ncbi:MAG: putative Zn-dependent protease-like protein [Cyanobacteria bacterium RYN_339]|nr:putative Zn-dependent protease-like protein [Cyanobacteria bacterium RYN_339]
MTAPFETEIRTLMDLARENGLGDVEVYAKRDIALTLRAHNGELESFQRSDSVGLGVRVLLGERVGYAYTENLAPAALQRVLNEASSNAELVEAQPGAALAADAPVPEAPELFNPALDAVPLPEKIAQVKHLETITRTADPRVKAVPGCSYADGQSVVRIASTRGLDRFYRSNMVYALVYPIVSEGEQNKTCYEMAIGRDFAKLDMAALSQAAVQGALRRLGAQEMASGRYPVIFTPKAMTELLSAFSSVFSAKAAQEGKSLLAGKLGQRVSSLMVSLVDDPLRVDGIATRPFDDEGVPSRRLALIEMGDFKTFLHNTQTARQAGVESTGHASRGGYKGTVDIAPSNLFFESGGATAVQLVDGPGPVVVIDDLQGLHAGTNPISGDFSLASQGHLYEDGQYRHPVHNFTVAGNFVDLLEAVEGVGDDLRFFPHGSYIGSPSMRVKELAIAGA